MPGAHSPRAGSRTLRPARIAIQPVLAVGTSLTKRAVVLNALVTCVPMSVFAENAPALLHDGPVLLLL